MSGNNQEQIISLRNSCLANAEALLSMAEREIGKGVDHVCFHLGLLALEEIGEAVIATINYTNDVAGKRNEDLYAAMYDHVKKAFWAIWGESVIDSQGLLKKNLEDNIHLATTLHKRRLESLYTNPDNPLPLDKRVEDKELTMLINLTRARLEYEKSKEIKPLDEVDTEILLWYFNALENPDIRKYIFSKPSLDKFVELQQGGEWIKWLRQEFKKHEEEMRKLAKEEIERRTPEEKDALKPKYKMRVRIQTPSHSIRNGAFASWNSGIDNIKLYKSDKKGAKKLSKGEIIIDFTFPKKLLVQGLWEHGLYMAKTLIVALNVATLGVFWWNVQKDIEKYYEEILDLERDPKGGVKIGIVPPKRLNVNFDQGMFVLDDKEMQNVNYMAAYLLRNSKKLEEYLKSYAMALTLFSKTDIHLRLEVNAFDEFYKALKHAMIALGDWDSKADFMNAVKNKLKEVGELKEIDRTLQLGKMLDEDEKREKYHPITLTEVIAMKVYCDYYVQLKARDYFREEEKKVS